MQHDRYLDELHYLVPFFSGHHSLRAKENILLELPLDDVPGVIRARSLNYVCSVRTRSRSGGG